MGAFAGQIASPIWKSLVIYFFESDYQYVTFKCDRSMRNHLIEKQRFLESKKENDDIQSLKAAEIGLIDCQDYDIFRKKLVMLGLSETDLSLMALRAIEAKDKDLSRVIETHEIRF